MLVVSTLVSIGGTRMFKKETKINPPTINAKTINNWSISLGILIFQVKWAFYQRIPKGYVLQGAITTFWFCKSIFYGIWVQQLHTRWYSWNLDKTLLRYSGVANCM